LSQENLAARVKIQQPYLTGLPTFPLTKLMLAISRGKQ
jgi:hypothetical protein